MNVVAEKDRILKWLKDYKENTHCNGVVLGISGGKDSTVVAMLAKKVWGESVVGVLMPNRHQEDFLDSIDIVEQLGIRNYVVNIGETYQNLLSELADTLGASISPKAATNVPPRLRMTVLYAIAQTLGYRVIGTGNASEAYIGWTTKWGDSAYDFNPIYHLTCSEVVELGKSLAPEFGLGERFVTKTPSDGLTGKSDEENFGFTYKVLDDAISGFKDSITPKIIEMHKYSEHKRRMPYTMIDSME